MTRPLILLTNDDGVQAEGLNELRAAVATIADVVVVAPTLEQSANSHALTLTAPLRMTTLKPGVHSVDGTPADCVYAALFARDALARRPDAILSGINHGLNLGTDVFYSGTVAAAREGALRGVPSVAISLAPGGDFIQTAKATLPVVERLLSAVHPEGQPPLLNINFPAGKISGMRATRLGRRVYEDELEVRTDPRGRNYFWIGGGGVRHEPLDGSDTNAIDEGWASVTPLSLESTLPEHLGLAAFAAGPESEHE